MEWSGKGFIGLAAKTYYCYHDDSTKDKFSAKGLNKTMKITRDHFLRVIREKSTVSHTNKGFIMRDRVMLTYEMERAGLSFFYCKRKVLADGVSTTYLDI